MIVSVFIYQRPSKDFILCYFIKIWAPIFGHSKAVTDLKNALYYPQQGERTSYNFFKKRKEKQQPKEMWNRRFQRLQFNHHVRRKFSNSLVQNIIPSTFQDGEEINVEVR